MNEADITHFLPIHLGFVPLHGENEVTNYWIGRALFLDKSNCWFCIPIYPDNSHLHPLKFHPTSTAVNLPGSSKRLSHEETMFIGSFWLGVTLG